MGMLLSLIQSLKAEVSWFFSALTYASAAADTPPADTPADTARAEANDSSAKDRASDDHSVTLASLLPSHADEARPHAASHDAEVGDFLHHSNAGEVVDADAAPQTEQGGQLLAPAPLPDLASAPDPMLALVDAFSGLGTFSVEHVDTHKAGLDASHDDISFSLAPFGSSANIDFDDAVISFAKAHGGGGGPGGGGGGFEETIGPVGGLKFHLMFDQSSLPAGFKTGVENVATFLSAHYSDNITINVHIGYGEVAGFKVPASALGESITNIVSVSDYATLLGKLQADPVPGGFDDGRGTLPGSDPTSGGHFIVSSAEAQALGISTTFAVDGYIGLSSFKNLFDYDTSNGVGAKQYDFYSVVMHEMTEVMGRMLYVGDSGNSYLPLDLFHFSTADGTRIYVGNTPGYFSIDNGLTHLHDFNPNPNGDFGDWASGQPPPPDSFDAFGGLGKVAPVGAFDLVVMDAIGWDRFA